MTMSSALTVAPALSSPEDAAAFTIPTDLPQTTRYSGTSDEEFRRIYEIERTVREIRDKGYVRIALQFPDELLRDSSRVYDMLQKELGEEEIVEENPSTVPIAQSEHKSKGICRGNSDDAAKQNCSAAAIGRFGGCSCSSANDQQKQSVTEETGALIGSLTPATKPKRKFYILADTSYGACCVDEIAAQHVNTDVVVHYGRACLSPTKRLPVIYVFTISPLSIPSVISTFRNLFPPSASLDKKILLMADVTYTAHLPQIFSALSKQTSTELAYKGLFLTEVIHNPSSPLPNRTVPLSCQPLPTDTEDEKCKKMTELREEWELFHVSIPLPTLLLVLNSRIKKIHVYPADFSSADVGTSPNLSGQNCSLPLQLTEPLNIQPLLRRRYALLTRIKTAGIIGILVSTLSVQHYLPLISFLKRMITAARKKSYLVIVGKVNVEKLANFGEIEGWVGIGCWEQGVVGGGLTDGTGGRGFYTPIVTPWELGVALRWLGIEEADRDEGKSCAKKNKSTGFQWGEEWITDFATLLKLENEAAPEEPKYQQKPSSPSVRANTKHTAAYSEDSSSNPDSEEESTPPEFDLRTGRLISTSKPLPVHSNSIPRSSIVYSPSSSLSPSSPITAIATRSAYSKELSRTGGVFSPSAKYLAERRGWKGLGSDYHAEIEYEDEREGAVIEMGRGGIARAYQDLGGAEKSPV